MTEVETHGTGQVERIADRAVLQVRFTERAKDRGAAVSALTTRIAAVEPVLDRDGAQVTDRRLFVQDEWNAKRRSGAEANQSYVVRITDLAVLNDVVADLVMHEPADLRGPTWELADQIEAVREAQRVAVADAKRRAEGFAEALGRRLGTLLRIADGPPMARPDRFGTMMSARSAESARPDIAALSLEPQLVSVSASCTTTWEFAY